MNANREDALRILGVGLSKTGTNSLAGALQHLGYQVSHYDRGFLEAFVGHRQGCFQVARHATAEAYTDLPTALFYREFAASFPHLKFILTERDEDDWWASMQAHLERFPVRCETDDPHRWHVRTMAYGFPYPHEAAYRKRYREHNQAVRDFLPAARLLVFDLPRGHGWRELCAFLDRPVPTCPFPHLNRAASDEPWFD